MTQEVAKKYDAVEDLPGVGPATAEKLKELGFNTIESLAAATTRELVPAGIGEKQAVKIIGEARNSISLSFVRADELMKMKANALRLTTGSKAFDELVGGGLESQTITELYGEYGVGKFMYSEAYNSDHQVLLLEKADRVIKENNIRAIIIDSLTSHFRSEYLGREMLAERQQRLNNHMHRLIRLARAFNAVAIVTNQVMSKPDQFFANAIDAVGGHIVAHTSHTRIYIRRAATGPIRIARLVSSPYLPEGERIFKVTETGIQDVSEDDEVKKRRA
ncbi:DNA repair and recombination protein RadA [Candidatus Bathyarchaeota archaeon]|nr:MAG: DNA repair and recombination protein RadA [Candidatus Bathyarchaeota archaeon]